MYIVNKPSSTVGYRHWMHFETRSTRWPICSSMLPSSSTLSVTTVRPLKNHTSARADPVLLLFLSEALYISIISLQVLPIIPHISPPHAHPLLTKHHTNTFTPSIVRFSIPDRLGCLLRRKFSRTDSCPCHTALGGERQALQQCPRHAGLRPQADALPLP